MMDNGAMFITTAVLERICKDYQRCDLECEYCHAYSPYWACDEAARAADRELMQRRERSRE